MGVERRAILDIRNADCGYGQNRVLRDVSLRLRGGDIVTILGSNGAGKTTLFKTILGFLRPLSGCITVNGVDIASLSPRALAKVVAYVPQTHRTPFPFTVRDVVLFGRTVHLGLLAFPAKSDRMAVDRCLELLEVRHLADRPFTELSGGERQLVIIARALAQEAQLIILDEPTANLDFGNQVRVIKKIRELQQQSIGILLSTHQPDHAFMLGSLVVVMGKGTLGSPGEPEAILTTEQLHAIYGVAVDIIDTPSNGKLGRKTCAPVI